MLTVTDSAAAQLNSMLSGADDDAAIRFVAHDQGLQPHLDQARSGDTGYKHGDRLVLVVEPAMAQHLSNHVLDTQEVDSGTQLTLTPNQADVQTPSSD